MTQRLHGTGPPRAKEESHRGNEWQPLQAKRGVRFLRILYVREGHDHFAADTVGNREHTGIVKAKGPPRPSPGLCTQILPP